MQGSNLESFLDKAKEMEKKYKWLQAAEIYQKASDLVLRSNELTKLTELQEKIGYCFFRGAFQAETKKQFRSRMKLATQSYEEAVTFLEKAQEQGKSAQINHAKAMIKSMNFWLATEPSKMKELVEDWRKFELEALKAYEEAGDRRGIGIICVHLAEGQLGQDVSITSDWALMEQKIEEGIRYGEKAIETLSELNDEHTLARAYMWTAFNYALAVWFGVLKNKREEFGKKSITYSTKALTLSKKINDAYLIAHSNLSSGLREWGYSLNPISARDFCKEALKYGTIAKDVLLMSMANVWIVFNRNHVLNLEDDPDKQREGFRESLRIAKNGVLYAHIFAGYPYLNFAYCPYIMTHYWFSLIETDFKAKRILLENAVKIGKQSVKDVEQWIQPYPSPFIHEELATFTNVMYSLSKLEANVDKKRLLLEEASKYAEILCKMSQRAAPHAYWNYAGAENTRALIQAELAEIEPNHEKKRKLLENAVLFMENCFDLVAKDLKGIKPGWKIHFIGRYYYWFGGILEQLHFLIKDKKILNRAITAYKNAAESYNKAELKTREAESYWRKAKLHDLFGDYLEAAHSYEAANKSYNISGEKIQQLREFYQEHSAYMKAWNEIEQAKYNHSRNNHLQAKIHYENAGKIHEKLHDWSYLSSNYFAWAKLEQAEELSRAEKSTESIKNFQDAIEYFQKTDRNIKTKITENLTEEEKTLIKRMLETSDLRYNYCQARILMETAKLLDREGNHLDSSNSYAEAAQKITTIISKVDIETEQKELKYLTVLCQAWEKMAIAEETNSAESYLDASELFEEAKEYCYTSRASLWALGNSNFCKGLAAGVDYQTNLDLMELNKAKGFIKNAATNYLKAGYKNASEYATATQRLFDAYLFMNQAERESDTEKRVKQYQLAENLLQLAAGSFMKSKQPEKTAQVQQILNNVREEKELAISFTEVLRAPAIVSSTSSFTAPTSTSEVAVGLEKFEHENVQANLIIEVKEVRVRESFCLSVELVNAGREPALLMKVEDFIPNNFLVVKKPEIYRVEDTTLNMKGKQLAPLKLVEVKLTLQPSKKGTYSLNPKVQYLDERGQNKVLQLKTLDIRVEEVLLENRVTTGTPELDSLLLGGFPEEYAVVLSGSPSDERELVINNFLKAGVKRGISFFVTTEANELQDLVKNPKFYLFLCNPKPKLELPDLPNVYRLQGKTDLNNLGIALTKAYRSIDQNLGQPKRICVEILSEVLEDYGSKTTRKWISDLITNYGAKGFVILAVMDPEMHPSDQSKAVLNLFDGEISIIQSDDKLDCKKSILVKKLRNQDYIKNPICLTKPA